ncbi:MAG: 6-carboxytetrahydropterin synthase QueD [Planctomycetes bacterium]|nr:6-carboxytetrahydropterin synthase QueD [Planctomycetota bacterium]
MYRLEVESHFAAAHQLQYYKGKCEKLHGHNWRVRITVEGEELDKIGLLVDFGDLKKMINETTEKLDHGFLNELPPFNEINPTSENLARFIAEDIEKKLPGHVSVAAVTVWESEKCSATYLPR